MTDKSVTRLNDDLIREALRLDLEAAPPPPPEYSLRRVEEALAGKGAYPSRSRSLRLVYTAAGIAACLLIALGGVGLFRLLQSPAPAYEFTAEAEPAAQEFAALDDDRAAAPEVAPMEAAPEDVAPVEAEGENAFTEPPVTLESRGEPPGFAPVLGGGFILVEEIIPVDRGEPLFQAAVYRAGEVELLWVASTAASEETEIFVERVGKHLNLKIEVAAVANGLLRLETAEKPGLARRLNGRNQALLVISGRYSLEELELIFYGLD